MDSSQQLWSHKLRSDRSTKEGLSNHPKLSWRLLTWNAHGLGGSKLLAAAALAHDNKADVFVITEAELDADDCAPISGYEAFYPVIECSKCRRVIVYAKTKLHPVQVPILSPSDLPVVAVTVGNLLVIGVYRQFALVTGTNTYRGTTFETEQLNNLTSSIQPLLEDHHEVALLGDFNLDISRLNDDAYYRRSMLQEWLNFTKEHNLFSSKLTTHSALMASLMVM